MKAIDFSRSYMRWFSPGNNVRILVEAACTVTDEAAGQSDTYYLIAPCRREDTHGSRNLVEHPSMEFSGVWGEHESMIIRTHWQSSGDNRELRQPDTLDIRWFENTRSLAGDQAVFKGTMTSGEPMVGRTAIRDPKRAVTAVMEYPINTMNVNKDPFRFQVDTGPILFPDLSKAVGNRIEMFEVAYVLYKRFDETEFTLRKPVAPHNSPGRSIYITDYSELRVMPAENEVLLAVSD